MFTQVKAMIGTLGHRNYAEPRLEAVALIRALALEGMRVCRIRSLGSLEVRIWRPACGGA